MNRKNLFIFILTMASSLCCFTQTKQFKLSVTFTETDWVKKIPRYDTAFYSLDGRKKEINNIREALFSGGFLETSVDSSKTIKSNLTIFMHIGKSYEWADVRYTNVPDLLLREMNIHQSERNVNVKDYGRQVNALLDYYENHGYPFTTVRMKDVSIRDNRISGELFLDKGKYIEFDSITVVGDFQVSKNYLQNLLDVVEGEPYSEVSFKDVDRRLRSVPFMQLTKSSDIVFYKDKASLYIYAAKRQSNRVDGIIGFAPNSSQESKLVLTGELNMNLKNLKGSGKELGINWRSFAARSQKLDMSFLYPYFLNTKLGPEVAFRLDKFDTSFLNLKSDLGVQYYLSGRNYFKAFYTFENSILLGVDTGRIRVDQALPEQNAVQVNRYGLQFFFQRFDNAFNPRRGYSFNTSASVGSRRVIKDNRINDLRFIDGSSSYGLYDSITLRSTQYQFDYSASKFIPVGRRATILTAVSGAQKVSDELFFNELFRLGGANSLRGFNERSIVASSYVMTTLEYRYLLDQYSFVNLFWNGAYVEDSHQEGITTSDWPMGFGAGINFKTRAGVFRFMYALGQQQGNPIEFNQAKVHFGFINYY